MRRAPATALFCLVLLAALQACHESPRPAEAYFVRGGIAIEAAGLERASVWLGDTQKAAWSAADGARQLLGPGRLWLGLAWQPGQKWRVEVIREGRREQIDITAPRKPSAPAGGQH